MTPISAVSAGASLIIDADDTDTAAVADAADAADAADPAGREGSAGEEEGAGVGSGGGAGSSGYSPWELRLSVRKISMGAKATMLGTQLGEAVVNLSHFIERNNYAIEKTLSGGADKGDAGAGDFGAGAGAGRGSDGWGPMHRKNFQLSGGMVPLQVSVSIRTRPLFVPFASGDGSEESRRSSLTPATPLPVLGDKKEKVTNGTPSSLFGGWRSGGGNAGVSPGDGDRDDSVRVGVVTTAAVAPASTTLFGWRTIRSSVGEGDKVAEAAVSLPAAAPVASSLFGAWRSSKCGAGVGKGNQVVGPAEVAAPAAADEFDDFDAMDTGTLERVGLTSRPSSPQLMDIPEEEAARMGAVVRSKPKPKSNSNSNSNSNLKPNSRCGRDGPDGVELMLPNTRGNNRVDVAAATNTKDILTVVIPDETPKPHSSPGKHRRSWSWSMQWNSANSNSRRKLEDGSSSSAGTSGGTP